MTSLLRKKIRLAATAAAILTMIPSAGPAEPSDPFVDHIVRVFYRISEASFVFGFYTDSAGQRCFHFERTPKPTINDIMNTDQKVCFAPGQTTIERSPTFGDRYAPEVYYKGEVEQTGNTLDMTFIRCSRSRNEQNFYCEQRVHAVVRLQDNGCRATVERWGRRSGYRICQYYPAS